MFRFLLFTTLLALTKCEDAGFFQGEWTHVALFAFENQRIGPLTCFKNYTFEVTHEPCHERANFDVILKINGNAIANEPKLAIIAHTQQEVENALNVGGCRNVSIYEDFITVHRDLTSNYRIMYLKNCGSIRLPIGILLAKQVPTHAALKEFVNSNEDLKSMYRLFLCTSELLQNPSSEYKMYEMTKHGN